MRRKTLAALFGTAAVAVAVASPAAANGPIGGCPSGDGWDLRPLASTLPETFDNGNFHDQNGDGWICRQINEGQSNKHGEQSWTVKDNTNPLEA
jgi:hypothetical protein